MTETSAPGLMPDGDEGVGISAAEETLAVAVPAALLARLTAVAGRLGSDLAGVGRQALEEFADRWEDYQDTLDAIDLGTDQRVMLHVGEDDPA